MTNFKVPKPEHFSVIKINIDISKLNRVRVFFFFLILYSHIYKQLNIKRCTRLVNNLNYTNLKCFRFFKSGKINVFFIFYVVTIFKYLKFIRVKTTLRFFIKTPKSLLLVMLKLRKECMNWTNWKVCATLNYKHYLFIIFANNFKYILF